MNPTIDSRVSALEAHRENDKEKLDEINEKLDDLIAAHERFRGAIKLAMWLSGVLGVVIGGVGTKWFWKGP